jgi:hypothetical protein
MATSNTLTQDIVDTGRLMLREFGNELDRPGHVKLKISLLFLARTIRQLDLIGALADGRFVSDGCILFRSLLERFLLFVHLSEVREFEVFDDWCFKRQYKQLNAIKSIREFSDRPDVQSRRFSDAEKERYQRVSADQRVREWRRPDMERVARKLRMKFLYDVGYDWGSAHVHPVSYDGEVDYLHLMGRGTDANTDEVPILVGNACLISVMHIRHFMNEPEYNWRDVLYDLIGGLAKAAGREAFDYTDMLRKVQCLHNSGAGLLTTTGGQTGFRQV